MSISSCMCTPIRRVVRSVARRANGPVLAKPDYGPRRPSSQTPNGVATPAGDDFGGAVMRLVKAGRSLEAELEIATPLPEQFSPRLKICWATKAVL